MNNNWPPSSSSFDRLCLHMLSTCDAESSRILMLASRVPNEGVTTVSVGLARALANKAQKPVLYIDAGMDTNSASKMLGLSARPISFESIADAEINFASQHKISSNIDLVQLELPDGLDEEGKGMLRKFIHHACLSKSTVIVDAGSLTTRDPYIWSELVSYRLLVIDSSIASSEELQCLRNDIDNTNMKFNGFVLNKRRYYIPKFFYQRNS